MIGLAYLENPGCYAGGRVATGRGSLTGQDEGERSDEKITWSSRLGVEALDQHCNTPKNVP